MAKWQLIVDIRLSDQIGSHLLYEVISRLHELPDFP